MQSVTPSTTTAKTTTNVVLLDDGVYYVICQPERSTGYLLRRCQAPQGVECVGGFDRREERGPWYASITVPYDEERDRDLRVVGEGDRLDVIRALWRHRQEALTKYPGR
ncbi:hypothetical protein LMG8323_04267 [Ralstonia mannitolilytica]|nr:hypothetical protein LMG8323_04267 [Ralstonia mannitolilytica]